MLRLLLPLLLAIMPLARAQPYPDHPVSLVVPAAPGGPSDVLARVLGEGLQARLGQPFAVVNRGGAGGNIGAASVARAAPDGHTLLVATDAPIVINPALYERMPYDPARDLRPVAMLGDGGDVALTVPAASPARTVPALVETLRRDPAGANYVSSGTGFSSHIIGELFRREAGFDAVHHASRGAGAAMLELLSGRMSFGFPPASLAAANAADGRVRVLAVAAATRNALLPEVPTLVELGYPGMVPKPYWVCLFAPAATPDAVVERLAAEVRALASSVEFGRLLRQQGLAVSALAPAALGERMRADAAYWGAAVARFGIRAE